MLRPLRLAFVVALLLASIEALATSNPGVVALNSPRDTRGLADSTMELIAADKINTAFATLKPHMLMPATEVDDLVSKTIKFRSALADRYGPITGYALVREDKASDFLIRYTDAEKRVNHALRWVFYFYRPRNASAWVVHSVVMDENMDRLFLTEGA